jgi:hypothetical protein
MEEVESWMMSSLKGNGSESSEEETGFVAVEGKGVEALRVISMGMDLGFCS